MGSCGWRRISAAVALLFVLAGEAEAKALIIPPRPGQVGLSVQGQYGTFLTTGTTGQDFGSGPGLAVRLRYRMRYERAIGLSFESQSFDARPNASFIDPATGQTIAASDPFAPAKVTFIAWGPEIYQLFGTRTNTTRMLSAGFGLANNNHFTLNDAETQIASDGFYLSAGGGLERFFWRSWAYDLSVRYMAVFIDGSTNHDFQASLGLIVYASY